VAGHHDGARVVAQEALEPQDRLEVEVVGRLVEQQQVGSREQDLGERDPHLPAARQRRDVVRHLIVDEAEAVQDGLGARLELVAAEVLVARLDLAEPRDDVVEIVAGGLEPRAERGELLAEPRHLAGAGAGLGEDRSPAQLADVLPEVAQRQLPRPLDRAVVGLLLAGDQPEHRGLARAVGPDQADLLAGVDLKRRIDEQDLSAVLLAHRAERDHAAAL
jgi:hypothetical protein